MINLRIQPSIRSIWLCLGCLLLSLATLKWESLDRINHWLLIVIVVVVLLDLLTVLLRPKLSAEREIAHNLPVGKWLQVELILNNKSKRNIRLDIFDLHPETFAVKGMPYISRLPKQQSLNLQYQIQPLQRGDYRFDSVEVRQYSLLSLWKAQFKIACENEVKVYPNFADMKYLSLLAADNQLSRLGVYLQQMRGSGLEFHQLREYQQGDSVRQIDWHATSKHRKLISKEFQEERDQEIICLLDCSRRMRGNDKGKPYFDHALNAMIQLGQIVVRQGDAFGFFAFSGQDRWFKPRKGFGAINEVLNKIYDLSTTTAPTDYLLAAENIMRLQKKRALIVIITNTRNEDTSDLLAATHLLQRKHLVAIADLRDPLLDNISEQQIGSPDAAKLYLETAAYQDVRRRVHKRLLHERLMILDTRCEELPLKLIQSYFEIKRLHSL